MKTPMLLALSLALLTCGCHDEGKMALPRSSITIGPAAATVDVGTSQNFTATVLNDMQGRGVTWTLMGGGMLSNATPTSVTYMAPAMAGSATVVATSVSNPVIASSVAVTIQALPVVSNASLNGGTMGGAYSGTLTASGGTPPFTWSVISGSLPPGLSLDGTTGQISGTLSGMGTFNFTVQVRDSAAPAQSSTLGLSIMVSAPLAITTAALANGVAGTNYGAALTESGGVAPVSWQIVAGTLPAGMSLNSATGVISGMPGAAGPFSITVQVTDSAQPPRMARQSMQLTILQPVSISSSTLAAATMGASYSTTVTASGGLSPLMWSLTSGALPTGLALNASSGAITGTPTVAGSSSFTVQVADASMPPLTASAPLSITVDSPLLIATASVPEGVTGTPYTVTLSATGGVSPLSWSVTIGALPAGLTLNSSTGVISGTPSSSGSSSFTLAVTDSAAPPRTATHALSLLVSQPLAVASVVLPDGTSGTAYSAQLTASGGISPLTWSESSGSLPSGITLSANTGAISGTTAMMGSFSFTVQARDSGMPPQTASAGQTVVINPPLAITSGAPAQAYAGVPYSDTLSETGGVLPLAWTLSSGTLPAGLTLNHNSGVISGTATATGLFSFTVQVADSAVPPRASAQPLMLSVAQPLAIGSSALPEGTNGSAYTTAFTESGGVAPLTWSVSAGSLPPGVTLNASTGQLSGTPTGTGTFPFTIQVSDSSLPPQTATASSSLRVNPPLVITTTSLPNAVTGAAYSTTLSETGGIAPLTWSVSTGSLPGGLSLNPASGVISGTPASSGSTNLTVQVADSASPPRTSTFSTNITVNPPLAISPALLPEGVAGSNYTATPAASGGVTPLTWSVSSGSLPMGLSLNSATGVISGTPNAPGTSNFTLHVADSSVPPQAATQAESISVQAPLVIGSAALPEPVSGTPYSIALSASGGVPPFIWAVSSGSLPAGLSLNPSSGVISGTPSVAGTSSFTVRATDSATPPQSSTLNSSITVNAPLAITSTTLPSAVAGAAYSTTLGASGGTAPFTWSITSGSLPMGLSLNAATGVISGTPSTASTTNFTLEVSDSSAPAQSATAPMSFKTNTQLVITSTTLPDAVSGSPYNTTLTASGGFAPVTWSISMGSLPTGLSLNSATGAITGMPVAPGTVSFTIHAVDSASPPQSVSLPVSIKTNLPLAVASTALPDAIAGTSYSTTLSATGGTPPFTWSVSSGSLPAGLSLDPTTGVITGIASAAGASAFTIRVADASSPPQTATTSVGIRTDVPLTIPAVTLPNGVAGTSYTTSLTSAGGVPPVTWSVSSGTLPAGLTLNSSTGVISGTPTTVAASNFTVHGTDSSSPTQAASLAVSLGVNQALSITAAALPDAVSGAVYSAGLNASGGIAPFTWSVSAGSLPAGLSLNASTGVVSGTPTAPGPSAFTLHVTDSSAPPQMATLATSLLTNSMLAITTTTLSNAVANVPFASTLTATGGLVPITWSVSAGSLPTGLSLNATTGVISGTPATAGTVNFTIHAVDSASPPQSASVPLSIKTNPPLAISSSTLPDAIAGTSYSTTLSATGGTPPFTWSVSSGVLPTGLSLDPTTGVITGTAPAASASAFTIRVADASSPPQTATSSVGIRTDVPLTIPAVTLPNGVAGTSYTTSLTSAGGVSPVTWSVGSGTLPAGLTLNSSTGIISGTPTTVAASNFTIHATDSSSPPQAASLPVSLSVNQVLAVAATALPNAVSGSTYTATATATGGVPPFTWSVSAGTLPSGLSLNSSTGVISGTPTGLGTTLFTLHVTDSSAPPQMATLATSLLTNPLLGITSATLPNAIAGVPFATTLTDTGGLAPITWSISSGSLPAGLSLNATTGVISGTPSTAGSSNFMVHAADSSAPPQTASLPVTIAVNQLLAIAPGTLPDAVAGNTYTATASATGGVPPFTWSVSAGSLPAGLSLNASTGVISGTPASAGVAAFTLRVADSSTPPQAATLPVTLLTNPLLAITAVTLPDAIVGVPYTDVFVATGGLAPFTWSVSSGSLPAGLSLNSSTGVISGTPTAAGDFSFTIHVADSASPAQTASISHDLAVHTPLAITPVALAAATVGAGLNTQLQATGGNPPFTWSVSSGALPSGVTLDPSSGQLSGIPTGTGTFNFTVQATDSSHPSQSATLALSLAVDPLGAKNASLSGSYAFLFTGFDANGPVAMAGSLAADGSGNITGGVFDLNRTGGASTNISVTSGSYNLNADNRGMLTVTSSLGTLTFRIAVNAPGTLGQIIEFDPPSAGVIRSSGMLKKQNPAAFSNSSIAGDFALGLSGGHFGGGRIGLVGSIHADGAGNLTSGVVDANVAGTPLSGLALQILSSYTVSGNGRGTITLKLPTLGTVNGAIYVISATELFFIRTDAFSSPSDLFSGRLLEQSGAPFTTASLLGTSVLSVRGLNTAASSSVAAGLVVADGLGNLAGLLDANDNGVTSTLPTVTGTYSVSAATTGRGTFTFNSTTYAIYLTGSGPAFLMEASGTEVKTGLLAPQSLGPFSLSSITGNFIVGSSENAIIGTTFSSGVLSLDLLGDLTGNLDENQPGPVLAPDTSLVASYTITGNGRITLGTSILYIVSPNELVQVELGPGQTNARILLVQR